MEKLLLSKLNSDVRNVVTLSHSERKNYKKNRFSECFAEINRLNANLKFLESQYNISVLRINALSKTVKDLKSEFDNLTDLCAKTILKSK